MSVLGADWSMLMVFNIIEMSDVSEIKFPNLTEK
jgi:hypothetical protein